MASLRTVMYKLQTALNMRGRYIKINQFQSWSQRQQRMVTKYVVCEKRMVNKKLKDVAIMESYQMADVVVFLAAMLKDTGGDG